MYEDKPELKVDELTMENTAAEINELAMRLIQQIAASESLSHGKHMPVNALNILTSLWWYLNTMVSKHETGTVIIRFAI